MKNKYYNLTEQQNLGIEDNAPSWMDSLFEKGSLEKKEAIDKDEINYMFNPADRKVKPIRKCEICNTPLQSNEISLCSECNK